MNDLLQKTPEQNFPIKKYNHLLNPKTDIFNRENFIETKKGKRPISIEEIRQDFDFSGKRTREMNEVHFNNIYKGM